MKRKQRLTAALLILCMAVSGLSETALADGPENKAGESTACAQESRETGGEEKKSGAEAKVRPMADTKAGEGSEIKTGTDAETGEKADAKAGTDSEADAKAGTEAEAKAGEKADAKAGTEADAEAEEKAEAEDESRSQADIKPDAGSEADTPQKDMEAQEDTSSSDDFDDPGRGRLSGRDIPEEFFGDSTMLRAASTGITHNSRFAGYTIKQGIDVSKWNGTIDWKSVKKAGIEFAFIRTSYRGTSTGSLAKDPTADTNMKNAAAAGVKIGAYIFSQAITTAEAVQEAEYLINTVKGYNITMPLVFDFEYYDSGRLSNKKLSRRAQTDICLAFCDKVKAAGYTPLVYANKSMLSSDLYASEISAKAPVWLAHYTTKTDYSGDYDFWQYTSSGKVSGISGNVDMNFWYVRPGASASFGSGSVSSASQGSSGPAAPKLSGKAKSYDKVKLSWNKVSGASGYALYRYSSSKKKYEKIKTIGSSKTAYTDTGRSLGTTYKYKIKSYKTSGGKTVYSSASKAVSVKTDSTMTGKTNGTSVVVRQGPSSSKKALKKLGINTGVTITGTSESWYRISIKISGKNKTGYISKSYVTIIRKPTLKVSAESKNAVRLKWSESSGAAGYQIQRYNPSKKKYETVKWVKDGAKTTYTNSSLKKNTTYKYRMRAYKTVRGKKIYSYYCAVKSAKTKNN